MLSVIVPIYNSYPYLEKCLNSICNQTYKDIEIICIDDGSNDGSGELLDRIGSKEKRIKIIHQDNAGVSHSRNVGLKSAKGELITFVDSDDVIELDMYFKLIDVMNKYNADIVHCGYKKIHMDGTTSNISGTGKIILQNSEEALQCLIEGKYFAGGIWNKIYKRKVIGNIVFDESLKINEDILFNYEVFANSSLSVFWDISFYYYYERQGSACFITQNLKKTHDCSAVAKIVWRSSEGKKYYVAATYKYFTSLINEYRTMLFAGYDKKDLRRIGIELKAVEKHLNKIPLKYRISNRVLMLMPKTYKSLYLIYNRIRKPNWDVKK